MNYLAHIFLSHQNPEIMMGNFLGDLIKNKEYKQLPPSLQKGVELHRKIDVFTDNHEEVMKMIDVLEPWHHKYSPVVVDIFFDYLLFNNWGQYANQSTQELANWCYDVIHNYEEFIPERHKEKTRKMIEYNWLISYGDLKGLHHTFLRVKQRAKFDSQFELATGHLKENLDIFEGYFNRFFPDVMIMTKDFINQLPLQPK